MNIQCIQLRDLPSQCELESLCSEVHIVQNGGQSKYPCGANSCTSVALLMGIGYYELYESKGRLLYPTEDYSHPNSGLVTEFLQDVIRMVEYRTPVGVNFHKVNGVFINLKRAYDHAAMVVAKPEEDVDLTTPTFDGFGIREIGDIAKCFEGDVKVAVEFEWFLDPAIKDRDLIESMVRKDAPAVYLLNTTSVNGVAHCFVIVYEGNSRYVYIYCLFIH